MHYLTFRSFDSATPVKALVMPHSTVQIPMNKDGLVGQKKISVGSIYLGSQVPEKFV